MPEQTPAVGMERKLAAIFSTDVAGYSRLMGDNEADTIRTLTTYREVMTTLIQQHRGRVVDSPGDNLLAEFASAVEAVQAAVEIQHELKSRNADLPPQRCMEYRIGINVGDVVVEGERLYGDGVNIAARLESLAIPGGICISGTVYDQVKSKLALSYEDLGAQAVKNIVEPVRVYRVKIDGETGPTVGAARRGRPSSEQHRIRPAHRWVAVGVVLIGAALGAAWYFSRPSLRTQHSALSTQAPQALPLPDKPSIIVLPFVNMSKDPDQEYFSDGLTEVLTGDLSKISSLFVIARNSAFTYKGKAVKVQDVGREMGVRYVLEGSVQKADQQIRIATQLIEAATGHHLWSEQYDRPLKDIFALQDEIVQKIVTTLKLQLSLLEHGSVMRKTTDNLEAYDAFLRGMGYYWHYRKETNVQARQMFERAIALDPTYAMAYVALSGTYWLEGSLGWSQDPQALERAFALTQKGIALDDSLSAAHVQLGDLYLMKKQHEQAIAELERAIVLDPNIAFGYSDLGMILSFAGRPKEAIELVQKAMRLDPHYPVPWLWMLGQAYHLTGQYEEAITIQKRVLIRNPDFLPAHTDLTTLYSELGREDKARAEAAEVLRLNPQFSLDVWKQRVPYTDSAVIEREFAALRKAGLK